jgi:hypothetical protein
MKPMIRPCRSKGGAETGGRVSVAVAWVAGGARCPTKVCAWTLTTPSVIKASALGNVRFDICQTRLVLPLTSLGRQKETLRGTQLASRRPTTYTVLAHVTNGESSRRASSVKVSSPLSQSSTFHVTLILSALGIAALRYWPSTVVVEPTATVDWLW